MSSFELTLECLHLSYSISTFFEFILLSLWFLEVQINIAHTINWLFQVLFQIGFHEHLHQALEPLLASFYSPSIPSHPQVSSSLLQICSQSPRRQRTLRIYELLLFFFFFQSSNLWCPILIIVFFIIRPRHQIIFGINKNCISNLLFNHWRLYQSS